MNARRSTPRALIGLLGVVAMIVSACGSAASSPVPSAAPSEAASAAPETAAPSLVNITPAPIDVGPGPNGGVVVRWFIGLGTGGQPQQIAAEQQVATDFNAAQSDVF